MKPAVRAQISSHASSSGFSHAPAAMEKHCDAFPPAQHSPGFTTSVDASGEEIPGVQALAPRSNSYMLSRLQDREAPHCCRGGCVSAQPGWLMILELFKGASPGCAAHRQMECSALACARLQGWGQGGDLQARVAMCL